MVRWPAVATALACILVCQAAPALAQKKASAATLVILQPDSTDVVDATMKSMSEAIKAYAATVPGARADDGSYSILSLMEACPTTDKECIKRVASSLSAARLVRVLATSNGKDVKVTAILHDGLSGDEEKRAERSAVLAKASDAARLAVEDVTKRPPEVRIVQAMPVADPAAGKGGDKSDADERGEGAARALPYFRLNGALGLGRAVEGGAAEGEIFAQGDLGLDFTRVEHLLLGVEFTQQIYDRAYATHLPSAEGGGALRVNVHERLMLGRLVVGYNLFRWAASSERAQITPFLDVRQGRFDNNLAPQTMLGLGGGLRSFVRVSETARVEGEVSYSLYDVALFDEDRSKADTLLASGHSKGALRYSFGASMELAPQWRGGIAYRGEWLRQEKASRFADGLALTMTVDL